MKKLSCVILVFVCLLGCKQKREGNPHVLIETKFGEIEIELFEKQAPKTVAAFLTLVDANAYENSSFYRVLNDENQPSNAVKTGLIQGGIWKTNNKKALAVPNVPHEKTKQTGITHLDGTLSMARQEPGTAASEFFICVGKQPGLDYGGENIADGQGYAAFGRVIKGIDIVRKIYRQNDEDQYFDPPVNIYSIKRI